MEAVFAVVSAAQDVRAGVEGGCNSRAPSLVVSRRLLQLRPSGLGRKEAEGEVEKVAQLHNFLFKRSPPKPAHYFCICL